jgi:hypothetical protein
MFSRLVARVVKSLRAVLVPVIVLVFLLALGSAVHAERPSSMKLFPEDTLVFIRVSNAYEFGQALRNSSTGNMLADPQLRPFVEQLYGDAARIYSDKAEQIMGISWDDLQKLPKGEVAFAVVARENRGPAFLLLADQGDDDSVARPLLDRLIKLAGERGADFSTEKIAGVEVTVVRDADDDNRMFGVFERENTIVVATDPNVLRGVLWHWDGGDVPVEDADSNETNSVDDEATENEEQPDDDSNEDAAEDEETEEAEEEFVPKRTLAENSNFTSILQQCRRPQDPPPHLIFFADPVELVRNFGRGNPGTQFVMGLLPSLGVDGLQGVGGAFTGSVGGYDDLSHFHVLLENPRAGVMQLPAFEEGDTTPQPFVPHATETYMAWRWNMRVFYDRVAALVDQFRYQGSVDEMMEKQISEQLGINFQTDVLDNLGTRYTWMIGYDKPARFRGQQHVLAIELKDEELAQKTLETVRGKFADLFEERNFGKVTYHALMFEGLKDMDEEQRPVEPFVAIMDGYLFVGGSCNLFERCIAARDGTVDRLVDSEDYARVTEVLGRETAGTAPVLLSISRFEETVRQWYDLLTSERTRELIEENKEDNPVLAALSDALEQHKLPPFETLAPYLAPGGAILYDTDNGYHGIGFTLQNEPAR